MVALAFFVFFFRKKRGIWLGNFIVRRILNNNAFVSTDEQGQEIVVMGKGIVFQKSAGDRVPFARAEQVFQLSQENTSRFQELIARIPMNYMVLSEKIIQMAEDKLGKKLDESIYITITDHIYSAVQRYQNGLVIRNTMRWEIQRYYPDEYAVGLYVYLLFGKPCRFPLPRTRPRLWRCILSTPKPASKSDRCMK